MDAAATFQSLELNSIAFFIFAMFAVLIYRFTLVIERHLSFPVKGFKASVILCLNLGFLYYFVDSLWSAICLFGLLISTYLMAIWKKHARKSSSVQERIFSVVVVLLWALLFLAKDPQLAGFANPFVYFPLKVIGISFIFFRCINYIEDIRILPEHGLVTFLSYVIFFPTLIAGPLERCDSYIEQLNTPLDVDEKVVWLSLNRIATGVIKKFVLADFLYPLTGFGGVESSQATVWALWLMFFLQLFVLFLDFSGYTDIMLGIGRLMGFNLVENFNRPFVAQNIQEFWARWHISLTSFIRDYIFTPLLRTGIGIAGPSYAFLISTILYFVTMMIIALWHATTWGFFVFGLLHGCALVFIQLRARYKTKYSGPVGWILSVSPPKPVGIFLTYSFISLTMLFWSLGVAESFGTLSRMFGFG